MPRWITVPVCPKCFDLMREDDDEGDYHCIDCKYILFADDLDNS